MCFVLDNSPKSKHSNSEQECEFNIPACTIRETFRQITNQGQQVYVWPNIIFTQEFPNYIDGKF
jgi:hypothetical protein